MELNKILNADILDIIFEGRNKDYGSYELRKTYNRRVLIAISIMTAICLSAFISSIFANDKETNPNRIILNEVHLEDLHKQEKTPEPPQPPPPPRQPPPQIEMKRFTPPVIVQDVDVQNPPPAQDELTNVKIGTADVEGKKEDGLVAPPVEEKGTGIAAPLPKQDDDQKIFYKVEKEAKFPGGPEAWRRYLEKNLDANAAQEDGAPVGNYTVKVQFIVDKEGAISNVTAVEAPKSCLSCAKEAIKIIQRGPHWEPAIQNGRKVTYQAIQFVTFQVAEE